MLSLIETPLWLSLGEIEETVGAVVSVVVVLSSVVVSSVVVVVLSVLFEPSSLLLLQEMIVRLKRNMEEMMSICLTWFPIGELGKFKLYHDSGGFYKNVGFYLETV